MNKKKLISVAAAALCLAAASILWTPRKTVMAQSGSAFTMAGNSSGVVIVDQSTGGVTFCTSLVNILGSATSAKPEGTCASFGRVTPGTGTSSLSLTPSGNNVFILNNQTGQVFQCAAVDAVTLGYGGANSGKPLGSCLSLGAATR